MNLIYQILGTLFFIDIILGLVVFIRTSEQWFDNDPGADNGLNTAMIFLFFPLVFPIWLHTTLTSQFLTKGDE